jgi:hypothetical protein
VRKKAREGKYFISGFSISAIVQISQSTRHTTTTTDIYFIVVMPFPRVDAIKNANIQLFLYRVVVVKFKVYTAEVFIVQATFFSAVLEPKTEMFNCSFLQAPQKVLAIIFIK